jgi:DNA-binding MarR family transcriptional regulator
VSITDETPLQRFLSYRLSQLSNKLNRQATAILARVSGLTVGQWRVIALLATHSELNGTRLGEATGMDRGQLSRTLFGLEQSGLIATRRPADDRRLVLAQLTRKGRTLYDATLPHMRARQRHLLASLAPAERATVFAIIDKLSDAADVTEFEVAP